MPQGSVTITPEELSKSATKYRKELLVMPMLSLDEILPYLTLRTNVRYKEVVGQLDGDMQLGPYSISRRDDENVTITGRTLETFLGSCVKGFDPNSVYQSLYGSNIVQGEGLKGVPITKAVWTFVLKKIGEALYDNLFEAKRNDAGSTTAELFNGFKTIADQEIEAGNISETIGNQVVIEAVTKENAEDVFKSVYRAANYKLKVQKTTLYCSPEDYLSYCDAYQLNHAPLRYNNEYEKLYIEGSANKCEIKPFKCVPDGFMLITPKSNMLIGTAMGAPEATFEACKSLTSHFLVDFVATMFFGCQFETISPEKLIVATTATTEP